MQTTEETNKDFVEFYDIFEYDSMAVSLYSSLKGYATITILATNRFDVQKQIDLNPKALRQLAQHLNYCADHIDEITPKY